MKINQLLNNLKATKAPRDLHYFSELIHLYKMARKEGSLASAIKVIELLGKAMGVLSSPKNKKELLDLQALSNEDLQALYESFTDVHDPLNAPPEMHAGTP